MYWSDELVMAVVEGGPDRLAGLLGGGACGEGGHVHIFTRRWADVDGLRARVEAAGVGDRVSIHHGAALEVLGPRAA